MATSRWYEYKETAVGLRENGLSISSIEKSLGIPRSTLSNWFKKVYLSEEHIKQLQKNKADGWAKARIKAMEWHRTQKAFRLLEAKKEAAKTLDMLEVSDASVELALAMLYLGQGPKKDRLSISSSDPVVLRFVVTVLIRYYKTKPETIKCHLRLRTDQNPGAFKKYWSKQLGLPMDCFVSTSVDDRSSKPIHGYYKGVCVLEYRNVAIQRKLIYLYNLFCEQVIASDDGGD